MPPRLPLQSTDLRGAARLATDATLGLADLVEAMHERIARLPLRGAASAEPRTRGLTGLVYKTVRGVTRVAGGSVDALLTVLAPALAPVLPQGEPAPEREAVLAALNGVLGDYLVSTGNPLATPMTLRREGQALELKRAALAAQLPRANGRLLVLVHGLCMNDRQWLREGHDHGAALARDLGFTSLYLHYNTGLHISLNGRALARQLEQLLEQWPHALQRLALLGHSMGGLVLRSAWHHGQQAGHRWPGQVDDMVFLGSPHHGAPLEQAGHWVDRVLGAAPYAAPFARLGKLRSAGITDLRHGNLVDEDWLGRDRFARGPDRRQPVPLPPGVRCYTMAASIGDGPQDLQGRLLGDGLVPLDSALGRHADAARTLAFAASHQWVGHGINHLALLNRPEVYAPLRRWLGKPPRTARDSSQKGS
ncbi:MAG: alpha/beta hydrolase [Ramlibacter sp.]|nr:alpha/beta hydrolase [Ramlibacter sp.]